MGHVQISVFSPFFRGESKQNNKINSKDRVLATCFILRQVVPLWLTIIQFAGLPPLTWRLPTRTFGLFVFILLTLAPFQLSPLPFCWGGARLLVFLTSWKRLRSSISGFWFHFVFDMKRRWLVASWPCQMDYRCFDYCLCLIIDIRTPDSIFIDISM